jgi:CelD/BcsL family acetyltransferase involved in cellulose biosynthesis
MKRKLVRENQITRIRSQKRRLQEGKRSFVDLKELREVQNQFDCLIEQMMSAKLLLASLAIGYDDVSVDSDVQTGQE